MRGSKDTSYVVMEPKVVYERNFDVLDYMYQIRSRIDLTCYDCIIVSGRCGYKEDCYKSYPSMVVRDSDTDEILYIGHASQKHVSDIHLECYKYFKK